MAALLIFLITLITFLTIRYFVRHFPDVDPVIILCVIAMLVILSLVLYAQVTVQT